VRSFKQVAVDQSSDDHRQFALLPYIKEILLSLQPKLKGRNIDIQIDCPIELNVDTYPGAISQILTNFIMNSLHHGFESLPKGIIHIAIEKQENLLQLIYADNGTGMNQEALSKLFDPFYTTKRGQGGSGLGAHIVYNLVTGLLGGSIQASCVDGGGLRYQIRFPLCDSSIPHLAKY
jgi:signal transduction histidine kinase